MFRTLLCLILPFGYVASATGHELADGIIERRVQISVKPESVLVEYSLAMNEKTLQEQLQKHKTKPAPSRLAMWQQYQKVILPSLAKHIEVTVDGQPSQVKPIRAEYTGWSHRHLSCLFRAEIELAPRRKTIAVTDGNFLDTPGNYRIAMKARSGAMIENTNVPSVVSRAKPVELAKRARAEKRKATYATGECYITQVPAERRDQKDHARQKGPDEAEP